MRNIHSPIVILPEITLKLDCKISVFFLMRQDILTLIAKKNIHPQNFRSGKTIKTPR